MTRDSGKLLEPSCDHIKVAITSVSTAVSVLAVHVRICDVPSYIGCEGSMIDTDGVGTRWKRNQVDRVIHSRGELKTSGVHT